MFDGWNKIAVVEISIKTSRPGCPGWLLQHAYTVFLISYVDLKRQLVASDEKAEQLAEDKSKLVSPKHTAKWCKYSLRGTEDIVIILGWISSECSI